LLLGRKPDSGLLFPYPRPAKTNAAKTTQQQPEHRRNGQSQYRQVMKFKQVTRSNTFIYERNIPSWGDKNNACTLN